MIGTLASCATNPATGESQLSLISPEDEIQMGRQADRQVIRSMGVLPDTARLVTYVKEVGRELSARSERPHIPWTFRVVSDSTVNAFALPGGFIYMTSGILTHFNSEAQLAAVVGHEIGHISARHQVNRISETQLTRLGFLAGIIFVPEIAAFQEIIGTGLQLLFLKFSRDDERQADDLGYRLMRRGGYDMREMPEVFEMLRHVSRARGNGTGTPDWLQTHPDPEDRRERINERIETERKQGDLSFDTLLVGQAEYLRRLDGTAYGSNPRAGFFIDQTFYHPELEFRFSFPEDWEVTNRENVVMAQSPGQDAIIAITLTDTTSVRAARDGFVAERDVEPGRSWEEPINGHPAAWAEFRSATREGRILGLVAFVELRDQIYRLMGYSGPADWRFYEGTVRSSILSFDRVENPDILAAKPKRIEIRELPEAMTLKEFDARWPSTIDLSTLARLNQVQPDELLPEGRLLKRVVGEGPPERR